MMGVVECFVTESSPHIIEPPKPTFWFEIVLLLLLIFIKLIKRDEYKMIISRTIVETLVTDSGSISPKNHLFPKPYEFFKNRVVGAHVDSAH